MSLIQCLNDDYYGLNSCEFLYGLDQFYQHLNVTGKFLKIQLFTYLMTGSFFMNKRNY